MCFGTDHYLRTFKLGSRLRAVNGVIQNQKVWNRGNMAASIAVHPAYAAVHIKPRWKVTCMPTWCYRIWYFGVCNLICRLKIGWHRFCSAQLPVLTTTLHVVSWYQTWLYSPSASLTITSSPDVSGYHRRRRQSRRRSRTVHCVASISRRSVETFCSHGCTDHSSQMPTSTLICLMPRWHAYWKFTHRWELAAVAAAVNTTRTCFQMRPWKPSVIVVTRNVDIVALGCHQTSGRIRRRATQRGPASWRHALTTSGRNCSKRLATFEPHSALRSHCCIDDKRSSTTTRNARTSSASSVRSSSTRWDASGTSRRRYSSPASGCSLHDRIQVSSYRILMDVINCAKFYRSWLRGLDSVSGRHLTIPIWIAMFDLTLCAPLFTLWS